MQARGRGRELSIARASGKLAGATVRTITTRVNVAQPSVEALEDRIAVLEDQLDTVLKFLVTKERK